MKLDVANPQLFSPLQKSKGRHQINYLQKNTEYSNSAGVVTKVSTELIKEENN